MFIVFVTISQIYCFGKNEISKKTILSSLSTFEIISVTDESSAFVVDLNHGINAAFYFYHGTLAQISIWLNDEYADRKIKTGISNCITQHVYIQLLEAIDKMKSLGRYVDLGKISMIPTAGWIRQRYDYDAGFAVVTERDRNIPISLWDCYANSVFVYYWMPLTGRVTKKWIESVDDFGPPIKIYHVKVNNLNLMITDKDYSLVDVGQKVHMKWAVGGGLAHIINVFQNEQ